MSHSTSSSSGSSGPGSVLGLQMPTLGDTGSILGAVTPVVGGAAILPRTGDNPFLLVLVITTMAIASLVLISFFASRIIRKFI
ncbi:MAG TPA: hypothetical protein PKD79_02265 [Candidatus Doudnabacteria bacterium]|nr:hypothetical protein [Candidatus Doudnabacteria bacterium]